MLRLCCVFVASAVPIVLLAEYHQSDFRPSKSSCRCPLKATFSFRQYMMFQHTDLAMVMLLVPVRMSGSFTNRPIKITLFMLFLLISFRHRHPRRNRVFYLSSDSNIRPFAVSNVSQRCWPFGTLDCYRILRKFLDINIFVWLRW